jgi:glycosyltransferase involved in cell wall biosynthesis
LLYKYYTLAIEEFKDALIEDNPKIKEENIFIFPMSLDYTDELKTYVSNNKIVGWLSQSIHFKRIDEITPYLNKVFEEKYFEIHIVADKPYINEALNVPVVNKTWSLEKEREFMQEFDIGIAPINSWADLKQRKGTFKLVQYMALGIVSLTSFLTYSEKLIKDGESGFLVYDENEWYSKLKYILNLSPSEMNQICRLAYDSYYSKHHIKTQGILLLNFYKNVFSENN